MNLLKFHWVACNMLPSVWSPVLLICGCNWCAAHCMEQLERQWNFTMILNIYVMLCYLASWLVLVACVMNMYVHLRRTFLHDCCLPFLRSVSGIELTDTIDMTCSRYDHSRMFLTALVFCPLPKWAPYITQTHCFVMMTSLKGGELRTLFTWCLCGRRKMEVWCPACWSVDPLFWPHVLLHALSVPHTI